MGQVTDLTYYESGNIMFPSVGELDSLDSNYEGYIIRFEHLLLSSIFKPTDYKELKLALNDIDNAPPKWKRLVLGEDYISNGEQKAWTGLRGVNKDSLVSAFVFCNYLDEISSGNVGLNGSEQANLGGANDVSSTPKFLRVWNDYFISKFRNEIGVNEPVIYDFGGVYGVDYYTKNISDGFNVTLEQYLNDFKDDYSGFKIPDYNYKNVYGL